MKYMSSCGILFSPGFVSLKSASRALSTVAGGNGGSSLTDTRWHRPVTLVDFAICDELPTMLQPRSVLMPLGLKMKVKCLLFSIHLNPLSCPPQHYVFVTVVDLSDAFTFVMNALTFGCFTSVGDFSSVDFSA